MLRIDSDTYKTEEESHYKTQIAKTQIILATSLRKDGNHIIRLQNKDYHKTKKWNTYTVSRAGEIYQHFDPKYHSDFLGDKEADKKSISIVLENMGALFIAPNNKYINWLNEVCEPENIEQKEWRGYNYWEKFTDEQIENTALLCRRLCDDFVILRTCIEFHDYNKDTHKFRGIVFRSNYIEDSSDINPLFNISKFNEMLQKEL
jgi:N-acetyl-anhydromuramyl-L-alanine amidase AmpD